MFEVSATAPDDVPATAPEDVPATAPEDGMSPAEDGSAMFWLPAEDDFLDFFFLDTDGFGLGAVRDSFTPRFKGAYVQSYTKEDKTL